VVADDGRSRVEEARTGPLPAMVPAASVLASDPDRYDPDAPYLFLTLADAVPLPWVAVIVDRAGRVVWALPAPLLRNEMHSRVAKDGRSLYLDRNSYWGAFDGGATSTVDQVLIDGTVLHTYATPGLHHPFTDLPEGGLAYGATSGRGYTDEQLVRVYPDDTSEALWDCADWLGSIGVDDTCMSNTLTWNEDRGVYLFSFWTSETVVEIDPETRQATRWFGHLPGSWSFDPPESAFWYQHGGYYTEAGTFLTSSDLHDGAPTDGGETVVREYALDEDARTLRQIWSFGVGEGVYGHQMGEALRLPGGDTLHNYGATARLREATPEGDVVWDVEWPGYTIGHSTPIADLYALAPDRR
jgi:hypothetical protein